MLSIVWPKYISGISLISFAHSISEYPISFLICHLYVLRAGPIDPMCCIYRSGTLHLYMQYTVYRDMTYLLAIYLKINLLILYVEGWIACFKRKVSPISFGEMVDFGRGERGEGSFIYEVLLWMFCTSERCKE